MSEATAGNPPMQKTIDGDEVPHPPKAEPKGKPTKYLILEKVGPAWQEKLVVEARGAKAAIATWLADSTEPEGSYVAVPARSWRPVEAKTTTETKVVIA